MFKRVPSAETKADSNMQLIAPVSGPLLATLLLSGRHGLLGSWRIVDNANLQQRN